ncbi:divalent metal cation transporter [Bosea sp. 124]|uniref:NRAMP family divalent metal transporter n=1 Tax=Bosea sp. 124 TaxID=2135642 RepID=UPI000D3A1D24|nr:divalent metal cation transporter [Bosea sp. 124]PTM41565.1 Mn2+/Fe2+ NRAMP family transporter [Bosea sp. 124]
MSDLKPRLSWFRRLGPGLITGAADDDPSGIATYSQAGAQFGVNMLWTVALTYPLMVSIQGICARIGRVTGEGLAANMARAMPRSLVHIIVFLLFIANVVNIGADIVAMGAAARLVLGWGETLFAILFAAGSLLLQVFVPYHRYVHVLKWLTLALFAYVGVLFAVQIDWRAVALGTVWPQIAWTQEAFTIVVAVFGTTISPYLFFWQAAEEVEDERLAGAGSLLDHPDEAPGELRRIGIDTYVGMAFSNLIAFFIILTTAMTLHKAGITDIATSAQAAEALRPIAGEFAFLLFSLGIIGTGLLALSVLAGSAAYAIGELRGWRIGLEEKPENAKAFYGVIALAMALGLLMLFLPIDPIKALFWSAVLNGVIALPLMVATMIVVSSRTYLGRFVASRGLKFMGWLATAVMAAAALGMFVL